MAFRLAFKISRLVNSSSPKIFQYDNIISDYSSQRNFHLHSYNQQRLANNTNNQRVTSKCSGTKIKNTDPVSLSLKNDMKLTTQNNSIEKDYGKNDEKSAVMQSCFSTNEETDLVPLRRKFQKSSTQNAIKQPLKMPRLANPFPEPVKTLPSDTVSDDEKAFRMQQEIKMEQCFLIQQKQELAMRRRMSQPNNSSNQIIKPCQDQSFNTSNYNQISQMPQTSSQFQQENSFSQQPQQQKFSQFNKSQPNFRRPVPYDEQPEKCNHSPSQHQQFNQQQQQNLGLSNNSNQKSSLNSNEKRTRGRRRRNRSARYLARGNVRRFASGRRQYSTFSHLLEPAPMTEEQQCEALVQILKTHFPTYKNIQNSLISLPNETRKEFLNKALKFISEQNKTIKKKSTGAPFPSYSEVKTFVRPPTMNAINFGMLSTSQMDKSNYPGQLNVVRHYATKKSKKNKKSAKGKDKKSAKGKDKKSAKGKDKKKGCPEKQQFVPPNQEKKEDKCKKLVQKSKEKPCPHVSGYKSCAPVRPTKCKYIYPEGQCKKVDAPYPSYSECCEDPWEDERDECKICPEKVGDKEWKEIYGDRNAFRVSRKKYSTCTNIQEPGISKQYSSSNSMIDIETKKKRQVTEKPEPCPSPFPNLPRCDYEETARQNAEKKRNRGRPKKKDKKAAPTTDDSGAVVSDVGKEDGNMVIDKIKTWLCAWHPNSENVKISKCRLLDDERETYIIEISDSDDLFAKKDRVLIIDNEDKRNYFVEMARDGLVLPSNIPDFMSLDAFDRDEPCEEKKKPKGGCGPIKQKKQKTVEKKKKCRVPRKRPVPKCNEKKEKKKKRDCDKGETSKCDSKTNSSYIEKKISTPSINNASTINMASQQYVVNLQMRDNKYRTTGFNTATTNNQNNRNEFLTPRDNKSKQPMLFNVTTASPYMQNKVVANPIVQKIVKKPPAVNATLSAIKQVKMVSENETLAPVKQMKMVSENKSESRLLFKPLAEKPVSTPDDDNNKRKSTFFAAQNEKKETRNEKDDHFKLKVQYWKKN